MGRKNSPDLRVREFLELTRVQSRIGEFGTRSRFVKLFRVSIKFLKL